MGLFADLSDQGLMTGYRTFVLSLEPLLAAMGKRGMPVSIERHAKVTKEMEGMLADAERAMRAMVPDEVRPFHPKAGYKKPPTRINGGEYLLKRFSDGEDRWVRLDEWKPSNAGLIRDMRHKGHPVPKDFKNGNETTNQDELKRLARSTKDLLYEAVLAYRQIGTILNNHMANWAPGADGRVHPTFYYDTGTGQLAARRPNTMNAPKHGEDGSLKKEMANAFRKLIVAQPGHVLLEFDFKSFHAQTLAFEAGDRDYLRLAKLDIHSFLAAQFLKLPNRDRLLGLDDAALACALGEVKTCHRFVRDNKAKRAVLGYGFGMGFKKLYMMNRESFDNMAEAKRLLDTMNGLFPRACAWRDEVRAQAHEQGYLTSRFGCVRRFWEVFKWSGGRFVSGGDDSEAAVAFLPANDAFCHIKLGMLRLEAAGWLERARLINQIHDALLFECPLHLKDEAVAAIRTEMERPSDVLINEVAPGGLSVEVGVSEGASWDAMREVK